MGPLCCTLHCETDSDEEDNSAADDSGWSDLEDFIVCKVRVVINLAAA
jgi:hypothetical protein